MFVAVVRACVCLVCKPAADSLLIEQERSTNVILLLSFPTQDSIAVSITENQSTNVFDIKLGNCLAVNQLSLARHVYTV